MDTSKEVTQYGMAKVIIPAILKCSDEDVLRSMRKNLMREEPDVGVEDIFDCDVILDLFDDGDKAEAARAMQETRDGKLALKLYKQEFEKHQKQLKGGKKVSTSASNSKSPFFKHKYGDIPLTGITQADAKAWLPPYGASIWLGKNGTWWTHVTIETHKRCVKPFGSNGISYDEALRFVLRDAWEKWLGDHAMTLDQCPVKGLFV